MKTLGQNGFEMPQGPEGNIKVVVGADGDVWWGGGAAEDLPLPYGLCGWLPHCWAQTTGPALSREARCCLLNDILRFLSFFFS